MQKRIHFLLLFLFSLPAFLSAQQTINRSQAAPMPPQALPGIASTTNNNSATAQERATQVEIGTTTFDLESAASPGHRVYEDANGNIYAGWHFSTEEDSFTDRGTGVNMSNGTEWGEAERVEGAVRGGYPILAVSSAGDQYVSSHINDGQWRLGLHTKFTGESAWTVGIIPDNTPADFGLVWGKIAIGGDNEEVIHAIGVTFGLDASNEQLLYEGVAQHPLYYRSSDKGLTWEVQDMILPGIDSSNYLSIGAEEYTIEAKGNTVAIGFFPSWGDAVVLKSTDGGDNWENTVLLDFAIDRYDDSYVYTFEETGLDVDDPLWIGDSLAVLSTDGHASMILDNDDNIHVTVGRMYYSADGSGGRFYFPGTEGLFYWNESFGANNMTNIALVEDLDMSDSIEIVDIAVYFRSLTSMQTMGVDGDNNIYVTYSALNELYVDADDNQNFRHVYIIKSTDGGATWTEPFAVINGETFEEDFLSEVEGAYPQIPANIGETIHLVYHQDFRPGLALTGDMDPVETVSIIYVELEKDDFSAVGISSTLNLDKNLQAIISPSLTTGNVFLEYFPTENTTVEYEVINALGAQVLKSNKLENVSGYLREEINMTNLAQGLYYIRMTAENAQKTFKVVKQ